MVGKARETLKPEELVAIAISEARPWLPAQGPIETFIHHNTLHPFESLTFEAACDQVAVELGCEPYLALSEYFTALQQGRVSLESLREVLVRELEAHKSSWPLSDRLPRLKFYEYATLCETYLLSERSCQWLLENESLLLEFYPHADAAAKAKILAETQAYLPHLGSGVSKKQCLEMLWQALTERCQGTQKNFTSWQNPPLQAANLANPKYTMIALAAAFLDLGVAFWSMPSRELGLLASFFKLVTGGERALPSFVRWLKPEIFTELRGKSNLQVAAACLQRLGVPPEGWGAFIKAELMELRGWAGIINYLEEHKHPQFSHLKPKLADFLAVKLLLDTGEKRQVAAAGEVSALKTLQLQLFYILQQAGISGPGFLSFSHEQFVALANEVTAFSDFKRRRLLHLAFEHDYEQPLLDAILTNAKRNLQRPVPSAYTFQAVFCIDDRNESLRRYTEETDGHCKTFGFAGFFAVDMKFQSAFAEVAEAQCPAPVTPVHVVREHFAKEAEQDRQQAANHSLLKTWRKFYRYLHNHSRGLTIAMVLSVLAGLLISLPLALRVLTPRFAAKFRQWLHNLFVPAPTHLYLEKNSQNQGYTVSEMIVRVENVLTTIGLTERFAPLVFIIGHGSQSQNNPHLSAYNCGACGGKSGAANARAFAMMANNPRVRAGLRERGVSIPPTTRFIAACHDTCSDDIAYFEVEGLGGELAKAFSNARNVFDTARRLNAFERCRRFEIFNKATPDAALLHVESRASDLREARPELGHASNAALIIGRRRLTRNLFLDRRAFLASYNYNLDVDGSILRQLLSSVIPVCAGINLEYYFSRVDNQRFGAGTKLPHNIVGLIGVMDGGGSDLRTGLPWQMVEIHEPVRLVTLIEAEIETVEHVLQTLPEVKRLVVNQWIKLAICTPSAGVIFCHTKEGFREHKQRLVTFPEAKDSAAYHGLNLENLAPAFIKEAVP